MIKLRIPISIDFTKNKKQIFMVGGAVALAIFALYLNFLIKPPIMNLLNIAAKTRMIDMDLKSAISDIAKIDKFKKEIEKSRGKIDSYEKMLPVEQEIPTLLQHLSKMAISSKIKILGITPVMQKEEKPDPDRIYQGIPILISAKSGYYELVEFLKKLENSDRFMKVTDISIKSSASAPNKHDVELLVLTYILLKGK